MPVIPMRAKERTRATAIRKTNRVYAIAFDLDGAAAEKYCGPNWRGICYAKIAKVFSDFGFGRVQGSVYFGNETSDAVRCVMAVQAADRKFAWFGPSVRDLRMLRVDEDNDLLPALSNHFRFDDEEDSEGVA